MPFKLNVSKTYLEAEKQILPADYQGNLTEEERKIIAQQQKRFGIVNENQNAGQNAAPNAREVEKFVQMTERFGDTVYTNYDMLFDQIKAIRKDVNRMIGKLLPDYKMYHNEVTNYQLNFIILGAIDGLINLDLSEAEREELEQMRQEGNSLSLMICMTMMILFLFRLIIP